MKKQSNEMNSKFAGWKKMFKPQKQILKMSRTNLKKLRLALRFGRGNSSIFKYPGKEIQITW